MDARKEATLEHDNKPVLTRNHWYVLIFCTAAWLFDGVDGGLFTIMLGPIITDITSSSTSQPSGADIAFYGGLAASIYLLGWALGSICFGAIADYMGRVKTLAISVVVYSLAAAAVALTHDYWILISLRFIAGFGSGAAYPIGATLVGEVWDNKYRAKAVSLMASGVAVGFFVSSLIYGLAGNAGWRTVMVVPLLTMILTLPWAFLAKEPKQMPKVKPAPDEEMTVKSKSLSSSRNNQLTVVRIFSRQYRRATVLSIIMSIGALVAFWSISTWIPQVVRDSFGSASGDGSAATGEVGLATALFNLGGVIGYISWGFIADRIGRKSAFAVSIAATVGGSWALFPWDVTFGVYLWILPLVGFGAFGAFSGCAVWLPEQFPTEIRATGFSFANGMGRLVTSLGPITAGAISVIVFGGNLAVGIAIFASMSLLCIIPIKMLRDTTGESLTN